MKEYDSLNESERRFGEHLERLENDPSYMSASREKFCNEPTGIGAKYLWLRHTLLKEDVPDDVMEKMIEIIKYDIQLYEDNHRPYSSMSKEEEKEPIFALLHCSKVDTERFWNLLQKKSPCDVLSAICGDSLLENTRRFFSHKRKLKSRELYEFFGRQHGMKEEEEGNDSRIDIAGRMRSQYRTYKKNKKTKEKLFFE